MTRLPGREHWLWGSLRLIDFSWEALVQEAAAIGAATGGAFRLDDLADMPFRRYEQVIETARRMQPKETADG